MTTECKDCKGTGAIILEEKECPDCKGAGKTKSISLDRLSEKDIGALMGGGIKCAKCNGTGKVSVTEQCKRVLEGENLSHVMSAEKRSREKVIFAKTAPGNKSSIS